MISGGLNHFNFRFSNSTTPGGALSVVPGVSDAEGAWTAIATAANIAQDINEILVIVSSGATSAAIKNHLLDIGVDEAGGTAYVAIISNIACGASTTLARGARVFQFPMKIKAASTVAVRIQGSNATAGTVLVIAEFRGLPSNPHNIRTGQFSQTIGTITGSAGVAFTPGDNGAEGAWVSLGTTTQPLWWFQICNQITNATITTGLQHYDLSFGDATNKIMIIENAGGTTVTTEDIGSVQQAYGYREVPSGAELFIRGTGNIVAVTGHNAIAIGIGG